MSSMNRLLREPPFRLLAKGAARYLPCSLETKVRWEALSRPQYAAGVLFAAQQAHRLGLQAVAVIEFGVASGAGLLALQKYASIAAREFALEINVYGFDLAAGLPESTDFRDHPDAWRPGDYPMGDVDALRSRLLPHAHLVLGDVASTVPEFVKRQSCPVGFVSVDLDLYSSTRAALQIFTMADRKMLPHTPMYFDDTLLAFNHRFAGELLAIDEFNIESSDVKIDIWRSLPAETAFPESPWLRAMYLAHDLSAAKSERGTVNVL